ncbi:hypothetical protein PR003_g18426 [Phytophthora rubi]|nr:hypothetical protein PR001_g17166 [Phytophthora rubi]KAE9317618.1 hypothetical protein PR003_g18426 [Phytophthora rubi]
MYMELKVANKNAGDKLVGLILQTILEKKPDTAIIKQRDVRAFIQDAQDAAKSGTPVNATDHELVSGTLAPGTAATDTTVISTPTAEESEVTEGGEDAADSSTAVVKVTSAEVVLETELESLQKRPWSTLAEALYEIGNAQTTPSETGRDLGEALAHATVDGVDPVAAATNVWLKALILALSMSDGRGGDEAARAVKTALDKDLTWNIKGILGKMKAHDGSPLYLIDWEPTWEPPKHLKREQIVRFEGRRFMRRFTEFEAEEAPTRKSPSLILLDPRTVGQHSSQIGFSAWKALVNLQTNPYQ